MLQHNNVQQRHFRKIHHAGSPQPSQKVREILVLFASLVYVQGLAQGVEAFPRLRLRVDILEKLVVESLQVYLICGFVDITHGFDAGELCKSLCWFHLGWKPVSLCNLDSGKIQFSDVDFNSAPDRFEVVRGCCLFPV